MPPLIVRVLFRIRRCIEQCLRFLIRITDGWLDGELFAIVLLFEFLLGTILMNQFDELMIYENKIKVLLQTIPWLLAFLGLAALIYARIHSWTASLIERVKKNRSTMRASLLPKPRPKPKSKNSVRYRYRRS
jgi:hypothetical protein